MLYEKEKEWVSERFLMTMDESTKGELSDNAWLKQEVYRAIGHLNFFFIFLR